MAGVLEGMGSVVDWRRLVSGAAGLGVAASVVVVGSAAPAGASGPTPRTGSTTPAATADGGPGFRSLPTPTRVLDTRNGTGSATTPIGAGHSITLQLAGVAGIPATGVAAVAINLTAVTPAAAGYLTVYPTGATRPTASNLNFTAGQVIANEVIATLGASGQVTIFNGGGALDAVADATGWFTTDSYYNALTPTRALDTRIGVGAPANPVSPGQSIDVQIAGRGGVPATGAAAVALNLTGTTPSANTYITAYPTGQPRPTTSNLNLDPHQTAAVAVIAKLGANGKITLYNNSGTTQLIIDISGWFTTTGQFTPITPTRVADTRINTGPIGAGKIRDFSISPLVVPEHAAAMVLSVTAVTPAEGGYLTVYPTSITRPTTSALNFAAGHTVANLVVVKHIGVELSIFNGGGDANVVIDVLGWFVAPLRFTNPSVFPRPNVSVPFSDPLAATDGVAPYTWSIAAGTLPAGLTVTSTGPLTGAITGTPTTAGTSTFTVRVADASGMFDDWPFTLTVPPFVSGAVWAWGHGEFGELGGGFIGSSRTPVRVANLSEAVAIASNGAGGYALRSDGTVWAWGQNSLGQLGIGTTGGESPVPVQVSGLTGVTAVAGALSAGFALTSDGTVWAWGANVRGELGDGTFVNRATPVRVTGLTGITAIAASGETGYALASDGTVWAWGSGGNGALGNGTLVSSVSPVRVTGLTGITAIGGGFNTGYALASDGTVWAWGNNGAGEVGDGTTTNRATPVRVVGLTGVTAISGGFGTGYAISDGTAWAWGANTNGQLGDGTTEDWSTPVRVVGLSGVTAIGGGFGFSSALTSRGEVYAWGDSGQFTLGPEQIIDTTTPVQVDGLPPVVALAVGESAVYALGTT